MRQVLVAAAGNSNGSNGRHKSDFAQDLRVVPVCVCVCVCVCVPTRVRAVRRLPYTDRMLSCLLTRSHVRTR